MTEKCCIHTTPQAEAKLAFNNMATEDRATQVDKAVDLQEQAQEMRDAYGPVKDMYTECRKAHTTAMRAYDKHLGEHKV